MKKKSSELDFLSSLEEGKEVTQQLISKKISVSIGFVNALIKMGKITDARKVFNTLSKSHKESDQLNSLAIKLNINNSTSRPFSVETLYDLSGKNEKLAGYLKKYSSMRFARARKFVEKEVGQRIGFDFKNSQ